MIACTCCWSSDASLTSPAADLGVVHFDLPGRLPSPGFQNGTEAVLLHVFVKLLHTGATLRLRGIAFALSLDREVWNWSGNHLSQTPAALDWHPTFYLQELLGSGLLTGVAEPNLPYREVDPERQPRLIMPIRQVVCLPERLVRLGTALTVTADCDCCRFEIEGQSTEKVFRFGVEGWERCVSLSAEHEHARHAVVPSAPSLASMLPPMHGLDGDTAAHLVATNAQYHLKLNFAKASSRAVLASRQASL